MILITLDQDHDFGREWIVVKHFEGELWLTEAEAVELMSKLREFLDAYQTRKETRQ